MGDAVDAFVSFFNTAKHAVRLDKEEWPQTESYQTQLPRHLPDRCSQCNLLRRPGLVSEPQLIEVAGRDRAISKFALTAPELQSAAIN